MKAHRALPLPPLRFERAVVEKVWGGRRLERRFGLALHAAGPVGETWELSDRDEHPSVVAEGVLAGSSLRELVERRGGELLGRSAPGPGGRFPLLVKFLDVSSPLSVQVHPRQDDTARGEQAKSEAWVVLDCEPRARVWLGLRAGVTREQLAAAAGRSAILELLEERAVASGDSLLVPGGTLHAIGGGVTLLEVQQNSDTTFRLYDWDRPGLDGRPRPLQIEDALRVADCAARDAGPRPVQSATEAGGARRTLLARCAQFALERLELGDGGLEVDTGGLAGALCVLGGRGRLESAAGGVALAPGAVWLLPGSLGRCHLRATDSALTLILALASEGT